MAMSPTAGNLDKHHVRRDAPAITDEPFLKPCAIDLHITTVATRPGGQGVAMPNVCQTAPTSYPKAQFVQVVRSQELPIAPLSPGCCAAEYAFKRLGCQRLRDT